MKTKVLYIAIVVIMLTCLVLGLSYGYFSANVIRSEEKENTVSTGTLNLNVSDSSVNLNNLMPIYDENYETQAYKKVFTINNTGNLNSCSTIRLNINSISEGLRSEFLKYRLESSIGATREGTFLNIDDEGNITLMTSEYIASSASRTYTLYIWISYSDDVDQMDMLGTSLNAKISVKSYDAKTSNTCRLNRMFGDINDDGIVNDDDMQAINNYIAGNITIANNERYIYDVNCDGKININDTMELVYMKNGSLPFYKYDSCPLYDELYGDINKDGIVDMEDSQLVLNAVAHIITVSESEKYLYDVNCDGTISVSDSLKIQNMINGTVTGSYATCALYKDVLGDVNKDKAVNATDKNMILEVSVGIRTIQDSEKYKYDINCDGLIDSDDALYAEQIGNGTYMKTYRICYRYPRIVGDIDLNGYIDSADITLLLNASVGNVEVSNKDLYLYDMNCDGRISTADTRYIGSIIDNSPIDFLSDVYDCQKNTYHQTNFVVPGYSE